MQTSHSHALLNKTIEAQVVTTNSQHVLCESGLKFSQTLATQASRSYSHALHSFTFIVMTGPSNCRIRAHVAVVCISIHAKFHGPCPCSGWPKSWAVISSLWSHGEIADAGAGPKEAQITRNLKFLVLNDLQYFMNQSQFQSNIYIQLPHLMLTFSLLRMSYSKTSN